MHFVFKDSFWLMPIPFVSKLKIQFLAQLPVNHLPYLQDYWGSPGGVMAKVLNMQSQSMQVRTPVQFNWNSNNVLMLNWNVRNRTFFENETILTLNWIVWNKTVFIKIIHILKWIIWNKTVFLNWIAWNRNLLQLNCVLMLNWIVWNRTVYLYKNGFSIK